MALKFISFALKVPDNANAPWFVSSPQMPGLLTCGSTIPEALENAAKAIRDLALAVAMEAAQGRETKPIFRPEQ